MAEYIAQNITHIDNYIEHSLCAFYAHRQLCGINLLTLLVCVCVFTWIYWRIHSIIHSWPYLWLPDQLPGSFVVAYAVAGVADAVALDVVLLPLQWRPLPDWGGDLIFNFFLHNYGRLCLLDITFLPKKKKETFFFCSEIIFTNWCRTQRQYLYSKSIWNGAQSGVKMHFFLNKSKLSFFFWNTENLNNNNE